MNKLTKGAIATAAGIALLMGGAGSFALWNSSVGVSGGTISAGQLAVADSGTAGSWTVTPSGATSATAIADITKFTVVPGDKLTYTKTVNVTATGNDLTATLALAPGSITAASTGTASANTALASYLTQTATITASGTGITTGTTAGTYTITPGSAGITSSPVTISVNITFSKSATAGTENAAMLGAVNLSNMTVSLVQN